MFLIYCFNRPFLLVHSSRGKPHSLRAMDTITEDGEWPYGNGNHFKTVMNKIIINVLKRATHRAFVGARCSGTYLYS